jgi:TDG/mug DNA glycosylase family protein
MLPAVLIKTDRKLILTDCLFQTADGQVMGSNDFADCFPPVSPPDAEILILGSFPGRESLAKNQYYAHPQNKFWRIMGEILGFSPDIPYKERTGVFLRNRIALWDVISSCEREGSLDSNIKAAAPNDFAGLFAVRPKIKTVFFNGKSPSNLFRRYVAGGLPEGVESVILPSTSPASAMIPYEKKLAVWRAEILPRIEARSAAGGGLR